MPQFVTIMGQNPVETLASGGPKFQPVLLNTDGTIASAISEVSGLPQSRVVQVTTSTTADGTCVYLAPGVREIEIQSLWLVSGTIPAAAADDHWVLRWCVDALNQAEADAKLPATIAYSATTNLGNIGAIPLKTVMATSATGSLAVGIIPDQFATIKIAAPTSGDAVRRLDLIHNMTGVVLGAVIMAVQEVA